MAGPMLRSSHNVIFQCAFHVVWSPKYRRPVLVPPVDERLKMILVEVIREQGALPGKTAPFGAGRADEASTTRAGG